MANLLPLYKALVRPHIEYIASISLETILPEGRGQFGKDPEKSYQDDGRIKRNGI